MQPDFTKLKPVAEQPNFAMLKPVDTQTNTSNAPFQSVVGENPLVAGAKAVGNLPSSIFNFGKSIVQAVTSPVETIKGIGGVLGGAGTKILEGTVGRGIEAVTGKPLQKTETEAFNNFTNVLKERYGSLEKLQKTATEDPFGFGADILGVLEGGAGVLGKTKLLNEAVGTVGRTAITPVTKTISRGADVAGATTRFGISQLTGLKPETITKLVKEPEVFKNLNPEIRIETANKVAGVLDERLGELSDMGKGYQSIRESGGLVTIPPNTIKDVLNKFGVKLDEANKIITSPESRPMSAGDRLALQDFIDNYGSVTTHTNNSFLNTREALSNLSKYDATKTNFSTQIARDLRQEYDKFGKAQIKGLKDLDTAYAPERELLNQLKKDIIDSKTGGLKDAAISKIANLTGKGKEQVLNRVKQIVPDIEERVELIKAVEDIENSMGLKVGTYVRAGAGIGALVTGNIPAIIAAIVAQPSIAVPLLKGAGYVGQKATPILRAIRDIANDVNNFTIPASFKNKEGNLKMGMSIEDISKTAGKVDNNLIKEARKYKSAEEFVKAQGETVFRGGNKSFDKTLIGEDGVFVTPSEFMAGTFGKNVDELVISPKAKVLSYDDLPASLKEIDNWDDYSAAISKYGREKGVDVIDSLPPKVDFPRGMERTVLNPEVIKTKSQLTDIWNKANKKK